MWKWIVGIIGLACLVALGFWLSIDKSIRYLIINQPQHENPLFWTTAQRDAGFRVIEDLEVLPYQTVPAPATPSALESGEPLAMSQDKLTQYMQELRIVSLLVLHNNQLRLEQYGLDFEREQKWTSFSVAKSFTSTLVGAAIKDGYIKSIDDNVSDYIPDMRGSAYDEVSIKQLLTMTSGVAWNEDYTDPNSDVSRFNFHQSEAGVDLVASYMRQLPRATAPGERWHYSTGETNLIGLLLSQATGISLSQYMADKIWQPMGAEADASWLINTTGHEISGCCIQARPRDFLRFGRFILNGAISGGQSILPETWIAEATTKQADTGEQYRAYGYQWWTMADGSYHGRGIFGQGIFIDPNRDLVIAVNANWPQASGGPEYNKLLELYSDVQKLVDSSR